MIFFPNCKINIGLNITTKRSDGYHTIESFFIPVPLYDIIEIQKSENNQFKFVQTGIDTSCEIEKNLVVKAFRLMQQTFDLPNIKIHLHKIIPLGAGLGGGSSDAAFIISSLNSFFNLNESNNRLTELSAIIGSDCPFFINNQASFVTGRGDILEPSDLNLKGHHLVLVKPNIHVSTAEAYGLITPKHPTLSLKDLIQQPIENWKNTIINDFEKPLFDKYKILNEIKEMLYNEGAIYASMSGSGSSIFGIFKEEIDLQNKFSEHFYWQGKL